MLAIGGERLILTHDAIAEGVHYRPGTDPFDIAWKLVAVNLSDLAAKGADVVITDINMPKMDGFELIEAVRAVSGFRGTPILVLSTEFSDEKKARARE
ncbi:response regulator, partial [Escherichia coli]|nr:response regulator [Escherichia coli]